MVILMNADTSLRKSLINRILIMPKTKLIEIDNMTLDHKAEDSPYKPEFVEKILKSMNGPIHELTPELEEELFGGL